MDYPSLEEIRAAYERLDGLVVETPVWQWRNRDILEAFGAETQVYLKLELFQQTGTFKPRGALTNMLDLARNALGNGVTAVSAGNHAIAVAYAAQLLGTTAKVVMPKSANPFRVERCRAYGAEVLLVDDVQDAFRTTEQIQVEEGRTFVHPFEGPLTTLGTATLGFELCSQVPDLHAVIVPVGGGGLIAGMAMAIKQAYPSCQVIGVEPSGADSMYRSLQAGEPRAIERVNTIADSLGAPYATPYTFSLCQRFVDEIVLLEDDEMRRAMALLFRSMKLAVEPAGAAATAALCGPLRERLIGKRVGVLVCGANIDIRGFYEAVSAVDSVVLV